MFQSLANSNLVIREWLNGSLFPLTINLTFIIGVFIVDSYLESVRLKLRWLRMPGMATATALWAIFLFESLRAAIVWWALRTEGGIPHWALGWSDAALILVGLGLVPALLRCTYIFTPPKWGHWFWFGSAVATMLFLFFSHLHL
jgi:hypothetical protein